jgi:hypothetical protein
MNRASGTVPTLTEAAAATRDGECPACGDAYAASSSNFVGFTLRHCAVRARLGWSAKSAVVSLTNQGYARLARLSGRRVPVIVTARKRAPSQ